MTKEAEKLRTFIKCFEGFANWPGSGGEVTDYDLMDCLIMDEGFTPEEANHYLEKALENGQIYEKKVIQTRIFGRA